MEKPISESETSHKPRELYEIKITPVGENTNTFKWIRSHPKVKVLAFNTIGGGRRDYIYTIKDGDPRYQIESDETIDLPSNLTLMRDVKLDRLVIAKHGNRKAGGMLEMGNIPGEAHMGGVHEHPNIVTIHDIAGDEERGLFMIQEYLPNGNLDEWIKMEHNINEVGKVINQVSAALEHIHLKKRLVFGDMKPKNIGFDSNWNAKIYDFGIAEEMNKEGIAHSIGSGTPNYEAPEQRGMVLGVQTDVYSLAATIFTILVQETESPGNIKSDRDVFEQQTGVELCLKKKYFEELGVEQVEKLSLFLRKALSKDPENRHGSVAEFNREFQKIIANRKK
jgi:serine/threonine protein kinase